MTRNSENIIQAWDAFIAPKERIPLEASAGRIAASTIRQYPPGIPEIIPGMRYSPKILESLDAAHLSGAEIIGVNMASDRYVNVLVEENPGQTCMAIQTYDAQSISNEVTDEIADFFRISFSAGPYFHFAFHESDPLQSLPHTLDFDAYAVSIALSDEEKRKNVQEVLREVAVQRAMKTESLPNFYPANLPNGFHLWTDKEICRQQIKDRLTDPGYVTLVRSPAQDELLGLLHSRMGTVERLFHSEEWSDPLHFSRYNNVNLRDDPKRFFDKMSYHFGLKQSDSVMTISAQVLKPELQGGDIFYQMMKSMALKIKPVHAVLPVVSEIPPHGTAHMLNTAINQRIVFGILANDHPVVFSPQMSQVLFLLVSEKPHWRHALKKAVREKREYRTQYYVSQPTDYKSVTVKPNGKLGLAVFAAEDIRAGERIAVFTGETYHSETAMGLPDIMRDHAIQTGPQEFVFGHKGLAHCLCHSCDPTCGIRGRTEIFAVRDIVTGEQVTWDYRCSENSNWVLENCLCGSPRCTGKVGNFDSLPPDLQSEYLSKDMVSDWIVSIRRHQDETSTSSAV